ncbi:MAG: hypothetical protein AB1744_01675, partial [Candidatus Zixiibacteriota bacterium]
MLLYFTVTFIELSATIFERLRAEKLSRFLHHIAFGVVVVGIALSSLHHSSLGSLFLVTPTRLHSLWYTPWLPLFFILSAMGAGMMLIVLIRIFYARWYDPAPVFGPRDTKESAVVCQIKEGSAGSDRSAPRGKDLPVLSRLATIAVSVLAVYLVLKIIDLFRQNAWQALLAGTWESWLYGVELLIAAVLPILLIALPKTRRSPTGVGIAAFSASAGLALNRLDVGIFGYF